MTKMMLGGPALFAGGGEGKKGRRREYVKPGLRSSAAMVMLSCALTLPAHAQTGTAIDLRYESLQKAPDRHRATPGEQFGDRHNPETGSLSFEIVDVSIPGNNALPVEFRRSYTATSRVGTGAGPATPLGDWNIELPRIDASYHRRAGWVTSDASRPHANCSVSSVEKMLPPPDEFEPSFFNSHAFWSPPRVSLPGEVSRLLAYNTRNMPQPSTGGPYYWVTSEADHLSCIPALKNAGGATAEEQLFGRGEGYLLRTRDGRKIWFDWIGVNAYETLSTEDISYFPTGSPVSMPRYMQRVNFSLYATRVEDRFGNWVTYSYSNKSNQAVRLDSIQSSDGRKITFAYNSNQLASVSANGRNWSYRFLGGHLSEVVLPDGGKWRYAGSMTWVMPPLAGPYVGSCDAPEAWVGRKNTDWLTSDASSGSYTVETPSGAKGQFFMDSALLGRSGVHKACYTVGYALAGVAFKPLNEPAIRLGGYAKALVRKHVSGPGLANAIWRYSYQSEIGWLPMTGGVTTFKQKNPDGSVVTRRFGNTHRKDEGLLLSTSIVATNGQLLSETTHTYLAPLKLIGAHPGESREAYSEIALRPAINIRTRQQATQFLWKVDSTCGSNGASICLDALARPLQATRTSAPAP